MPLTEARYSNAFVQVKNFSVEPETKFEQFLEALSSEERVADIKEAHLPLIYDYVRLRMACLGSIVLLY
jgi:hypothetical protein